MTKMRKNSKSVIAAAALLALVAPVAEAAVVAEAAAVETPVDDTPVLTGEVLVSEVRLSDMLLLTHDVGMVGLLRDLAYDPTDGTYVPGMLALAGPEVISFADVPLDLPVLLLDAVTDLPVVESDALNPTVVDATDEEVLKPEEVETEVVVTPVTTVTVKAEKKPRMEKLATDSGRTPAEVAGNRRIVALLQSCPPEGVTGRQLADAAGFTSNITTNWVYHVAGLNGLDTTVTQGARNLYRYRCAKPAAEEVAAETETQTGAETGAETGTETGQEVAAA